VKQLTPEREEEIRAIRRKIHRCMPDLVRTLDQFSAEGLIEGWRCVRRFRLHTDPPWPPEKAYPAWKTGNEFIAKEKS
jgi:hypothetical protein